MAYNTSSIDGNVEALINLSASQGAGVKTDITKKVHRTAYPAISPLRPELSQEGKTVLITGGGTNIGLAITKGFVQAGAKIVIIIGRRIEVLETAKNEILAEAAAGAKKTEVITKSVDVTDKTAIRGLWSDLKQKGVEVDVLVLNAAKFGGFNTLFDEGADTVWEAMEANVYGPLLMAELFSKQGVKDKRKVIVNVSTAAAHVFEKEENILAALNPTYNLSKASGTLAMQLVAIHADPAKLTVVSFHPGVLHTSNWEAAGVSASMMPFDDSKYGSISLVTRHEC